MRNKELIKALTSHILSHDSFIIQYDNEHAITFRNADGNIYKGDVIVVMYKNSINQCHIIHMGDGRHAAELNGYVHTVEDFRNAVRLLGITKKFVKRGKVSG